MQSSKQMQRVFSGLLMLAMVPMMGCQTAMIAGITSEAATAAGACKVWPYTSYNSALDTKKTVDGNRANNRAKKAYCANIGENR